jgi:hypothetical protein
MSNPEFTILSNNVLYTNSLTPLQVKALSSDIYSSSYYIWDFGDGVKSTGLSAEHIYDSVGEYEITLTQYLSSGEPVTSESQPITAVNLIPNLMDWDLKSFNSGSITASIKNSTPYIVNTFNSWQQYDENSFLHLYVENSKSIPFDITDKKIHLKPNWRFLDSDDNVIETLPLNQTKIYAYKLDGEIYLDTVENDNSIFVGVSSQTEFYFIDDTPSGIDPSKTYLPSTLIVSQNLSSIYGDTKFTSEDYIQYPSLIKSIFIDNIVPDKLYISSNGIFDIPYLKFQNTKIPYNIRLVDSGGNFIKTNPVESDSVSAYEMNIGFIGDIAVDSIPSLDGNSLERFKLDFSNLGGFYESYFIPLNTTTESIILTASTLLDYTINEQLTRYGIFSDENSNKIYRASYVKDLYNEYIRKNSEVIGNEHDKFASNKFGAVIDLDYNSVFLDSDDSRIEIYDTSFELISSIGLSSYDEYPIVTKETIPLDAPIINLTKEGDSIYTKAYDMTFNLNGDILAFTTGNDEVNVYQLSSGSWVQLGQTLSGDGSSFYGQSIDLNDSGDILAVGSRLTYVNAYVNVYQLSSGSWVQLGSTITQSGAVKVNSSGNILVTGFITGNGGGTNSGEVNVYQLSSGSWVQLGSTIDGDNSYDRLGTSVDINPIGDIIAVGASTFGTNVGQVKTFILSSGDWVQYGGDLYGDNDNDNFGEVVKINDAGDIIAVSSPNSDENGSNSGSVDIYQLSSGSWVQLGQTLNNQSTSNSNFGEDIDLSGDGNTIVVGAPYHDTPSNNIGLAKVYKYNDGWVEYTSLTGLQAGDNLGISVCINNDGDKIGISAIDSDSGGVNVGEIEIYNINITDTETITLTSFRGHPSPAQIQLDQEGNYFITLHDAAKLVYKTENTLQVVDLYTQLPNNLVYYTDLYEPEPVLSGGEYLIYGQSGEFQYTPAALDILSDNETLYIAYTSAISSNFIEHYNIIRGGDDTLSSLSSTGTISLSSEVPMDMVSDRMGESLYVLTTDYHTRESYIKRYLTSTNTLSSNTFVGYDAEFLTIDTDQNPWTIAKIISSSDEYNAISKVTDGIVKSESLKQFTESVYVSSVSISSQSSKPDDDYTIKINNERVVDPQRNVVRYPIDYIWSYTGEVYINDVIEIEVFDGWQGSYRLEPWDMTLEWSDGVTEHLSGGYSSGDQSSDPSIPSLVDLGISSSEYYSSPAWATFWYSTDTPYIVSRNDITDTIKPVLHVGGIAGDSYGNIWVLDSSNDRVIIFNKDDPTSFSIQKISEDTPNDNKYAAYGDWNSFRWYNKFGYGGTTITYELSGQSDPFIIYPQNKFNLQKINEDHNMTETIKSYRTTELMFNYDNLFDNFLGSIYGNDLDDGTYIGKNFYEKIANFVLNHGDIETCSIDALESFCEETGIEFDGRLNFPRDIKRIVDLFSIKFKKLWGDNYKTGIIENYKGDLLDTSSYVVSADPQVKFIAREKFNDDYTFITPLIVDGLSSYPISSYEQKWGWGLAVPTGQYIGDYYDFYELLPIEDQRFKQIIDWDNELNDEELLPLSSFSNYMTENGIVSTVLGDKLRNGLGLYL